MTTGNESFQKQYQAVSIPLWREAGLIPEWLKLRASPIFSGQNVPPGDGTGVVTIPGFMCSDLYTQTLTQWLRRIGYRAYPSGLERNNDCIEKLLSRLLATIARAAEETNGQVHLIGHSLGGVMARIAATQRPELIASVITLASPFRGIRAHPYILWLGQRVRERVESDEAPHCFTGFCDCPSVTTLQKELPQRISTCAIYTRSDGIVDWQMCVNDDPALNLEVAGTHVGLVFNEEVYQAIAHRLAHQRSARHNS